MGHWRPGTWGPLLQYPYSFLRRLLIQTLKQNKQKPSQKNPLGSICQSLCRLEAPVKAKATELSSSTGLDPASPGKWARALLPSRAHRPLLFPQRLCQGHHSQVERSSETSREWQEPKLPKFCLQKKKSQAWVSSLVTSSEKGQEGSEPQSWVGKCWRHLTCQLTVMTVRDDIEDSLQSHQLHPHTHPQ